MRGNEAAGGAAGCVLRVRVLKPKVGGGWRVEGGVGQGCVHKRVQHLASQNWKKSAGGQEAGGILRCSGTLRWPLKSEIKGAVDKTSTNGGFHVHMHDRSRGVKPKKGDADRSLGPRLSAVLCKFKGPVCNF